LDKSGIPQQKSPDVPHPDKESKNILFSYNPFPPENTEEEDRLLSDLEPANLFLLIRS
jgi:hypothetical protein